jgi:hypothetical protein
MPKSLLGWAALIIAVVIIWRNPSATGNFLFTTIPAKVSAFFGNI